MKKVLNFSLLVLILVFSTGCRHFKSEKSEIENTEIKSEFEEEQPKDIKVTDFMIYSGTDNNGDIVMKDSIIAGNKTKVIQTPYQTFYVKDFSLNIKECFSVVIGSNITSDLLKKEVQNDFCIEEAEPVFIKVNVRISKDFNAYEMSSVFIYDKDSNPIEYKLCIGTETPLSNIGGKLYKCIQSLIKDAHNSFKDKIILEDLSGEWICNNPKFNLELTLSHDVGNQTLTVKECAIYRHAIWDKAKGSIDKKHINITQEDGFDGSIKLDLEPQGKDILEGSCHAEGQVKFNGRITLERKPTNNAKYFLGQREWTAYEYKKTYADATEKLILQFRGDILMMDGEYIIQDGNCFGGDYSTNGYNISIVIRNGYSDMLGLPQRFKGKFSKDMKKLTLKNVLNKKSLVLHLNENLPTPPERDFNRMY